MSLATTDPYSVTIFVKDGDPEGVRILGQMNWTGEAIIFPREQWPAVKRMEEFTLPGVYILSGYATDSDEEPTLYIGEGDGIGNRIEAHFQNKLFWSTGIAFVSKHQRLNKAHIQWLEYALVRQAKAAGRSRLENGNSPQEPALADSEKAGTQTFFREILKVLPLAGLRAFEVPRAIRSASAGDGTAAPVPASTRPKVNEGAAPDTIIVPAQPEGFQEVFLKTHRWRAVRIAPGRLDQIKWIAAYQVAPTRAITHVAPVARIEPYGENGKYQLIFAEPASAINPIPFGNAPNGFLQGIKYTSIETLRAAQTLNDLVDR